MSTIGIDAPPISCEGCHVTPEDPATQLENMCRWAGDYWLCVDIAACVERMFSTPEPPAAGEAQAGEPGTATADGTTPVGPVAEAGPGDAQAWDAPTNPAPGEAPEAPEPASTPGAGDGGRQPDASPGAEQQADEAPDAEPQP